VTPPNTESGVPAKWELTTRIPGLPVENLTLKNANPALACRRLPTLSVRERGSHPKAGLKYLFYGISVAPARLIWSESEVLSDVPIERRKRHQFG
jgi:hypothetical protein